MRSPNPANSTRLPVPSQPETSPTDPGELKLVEERPEAVPHTAAFPRPAMVRLIVAYSFGAAAFAAVVTCLKFWSASPPLLAVAWLVEWWTNLWPLVPTLVLLLVLDRPVARRLVFFIWPAAQWPSACSPPPDSFSEARSTARR